MHEEMDENQNEVEVYEVFEPQGVYNFLDGLFVIDIITLSLLKWLNKIGIKHSDMLSIQRELNSIRKHVAALKKYIRNLTIEVLGGAQVHNAKRRHCVLWRIIRRVLKGMQGFK